jgi:hypothetical protein
MSRLTADERRRANELRRNHAAGRMPRAVTVDQLQARTEGWGLGARIATLVAVGAGGLFAVAQLAEQLALLGPASMLDWLLPRL